jgi:hypothetical protein
MGERRAVMRDVFARLAPGESRAAFAAEDLAVTLRQDPGHPLMLGSPPPCGT